MTWLRALRSSRLSLRLSERRAFSAALAGTDRNGGLKLHLGCGPRPLPQWINIDDVARRPGVLVMRLPGDNQAFFAIQSELHPRWCTTKLEHLMYALQQDGEHKYGYDFETLHKLLNSAGFGSIMRSDYNASQFETLRVDTRGIRDDAGGYLSLFVDAVK